jgi:hypothetical protein
MAMFNKAGLPGVSMCRVAYKVDGEHSRGNMGFTRVPMLSGGDSLAVSLFMPK